MLFVHNYIGFRLVLSDFGESSQEVELILWLGILNII